MDKLKNIKNEIKSFIAFLQERNIDLTQFYNIYSECARGFTDEDEPYFLTSTCNVPLNMNISKPVLIAKV